MKPCSGDLSARLCYSRGALRGVFESAVRDLPRATIQLPELRRDRTATASGLLSRLRIPRFQNREAPENKCEAAAAEESIRLFAFHTCRVSTIRQPSAGHRLINFITPRGGREIFDRRRAEQRARLPAEKEAAMLKFSWDPRDRGPRQSNNRGIIRGALAFIPFSPAGSDRCW